MHAPEGTAAGPSQPLPGARQALMLLLFINLFNYIDRQVLAAVEPEIRRELLAEASPQQAKTRMGLLSTAFLFSYMLTAPLFGYWANYLKRWLLVGIGVTLWSLASGASGWNWTANLAVAYWALFLTRCLVGIGEGAYGPIAPAMLADLYPIERRGQVMAWFYLAIPVGGALGYALGEVVQRTLGWRWAFYLVVPPGIALGIWCFFMKDPPRGQSDAIPAPGDAEDPALIPTSTEPATAPLPLTTKPGQKHVTLRESLRVLLMPSYVLNTLGMTAMTFAIGGLAFWMPDYLEQRAAPDVGPFGPRTFFGIITATAGLIATLSGGLAGDWLRKYYRGSYFLVSGLALLLGFPMVLGVLYTSFPLTWVFIFLAVFCLFFNTGPTNTILANVTHPSMRASAFALNILIIHALGDAISPPIIGYLADQDENKSLNSGFILVSALMLVGGIFWLWGTRFLERDTAMAPRRG